jgi:hypothetical protein
MKKEKKTSTKMLVLVVINILWFTIAAIFLQFKTSVELSSTLITCWYAFWTSEIFLLAGIKITKVKHSDDGEEDSDDVDSE